MSTWTTAWTLTIVGLVGAHQNTSEIIRGRQLYRENCAACHGAMGRGDGPVVGSMRIAPPDLTRIQKPGQQFPASRLRQVMDGRDLATAHGARDMPVWGSVFRAESGGACAEHDLDALIAYLATIQVNQ